MSKNKFNNNKGYTPERTVEVPAAEVKTETAAVAADTTETAPEKKKPGRKPGSKSAPKVKKEPAKTEIRLQLHGNDISLTELEDKVKAKFVEEGHRAGCIKDLTIYAKPEENKAYYVINEGKFTGDVDLF